jgi:hypothetical protein
VVYIEMKVDSEDLEADVGAKQKSNPRLSPKERVGLFVEGFFAKTDVT